ncbi:MAG: class IIb bacteriocin, lactobin A/cerein 7B family [Porticoccaceae bacterium]|nr:class IIb bacteriocin, lactobin A/cerein 7B family [Porticoccaceae bacterium]MDG1322676.1 class IIb bacteriocin, lactobin A/cerein 7B family [Porticoccaceae bacterium]
MNEMEEVNGGVAPVVVAVVLVTGLLWSSNAN